MHRVLTGKSNNNNSSYQCCSLKQSSYQEDDKRKQDPGHILTSGANTRQHEPGHELHESSQIWPTALLLKVTHIHRSVSGLVRFKKFLK